METCECGQPFSDYGAAIPGEAKWPDRAELVADHVTDDEWAEGVTDANECPCCGRIFLVLVEDEGCEMHLDREIRGPQKPCPGHPRP